MHHISIDVERYSGIHNYPSICLVSDPIKTSFHNLPNTRQTLYSIMLLCWQSVRRSLESVTYPPSLEPGTCGVRIHFAISPVTINCLCPLIFIHKQHNLSYKITQKYYIFSRQASLARQAFLITPLHGARLKTGKTLTPKSSAMKSYVKLMRHPQHWHFPQFRCNM